MLGSLGRGLLAASFSLISLLPSAAQADQLIDLRQGRLTEEEWQAVKAYFLDGWREPDFTEYLISYMDAATAEEAWSKFRNERFHSGYYDLDGDGQGELIAYILFACGQLGCDTVVFRKEAGRWQEMMDLTVSDAEYFCASDERHHGYPDLYSAVYAYRWTGREYSPVCIHYCSESARCVSYCEEADQISPPSPEELDLRREFRRRNCLAKRDGD